METQVLDSLRYCKAKEEAGPKGSNLRNVAATCASSAGPRVRLNHTPAVFASAARIRSVSGSGPRRAKRPRTSDAPDG